MGHRQHLDFLMKAKGGGHETVSCRCLFGIGRTCFSAKPSSRNAYYAISGFGAACHLIALRHITYVSY